jgi:zinc transporter family protein
MSLLGAMIPNGLLP